MNELEARHLRLLPRLRPVAARVPGLQGHWPSSVAGMTDCNSQCCPRPILVTEQRGDWLVWKCIACGWRSAP